MKLVVVEAVKVEMQELLKSGLLPSASSAAPSSLVLCARALLRVE